MNKNSLLQDLCEIGAIKFGEFTLKSGLNSPIYIDLRLIISFPSILKSISAATWELVINKGGYDLVCGVPYTALPIATCISAFQDLPMVIRRKERKNYGTGKIIEGNFKKGDTCLIVEDLVTSGSSVLETITPLEEVGIKVEDVVVIIDRQQLGRDKLESKGINLYSLLTMTEILDYLLEANILSAEKYENLLSYIQ